MVVIPKDNSDHYTAAIKKCCLEKLITSQCVLAMVLNKFNSKHGGLMSVATKVAIQLNRMFRGEP